MTNLRILVLTEASLPLVGGLPTYSSTVSEVLARVGADVTLLSGNEADSIRPGPVPSQVDMDTATPLVDLCNGSEKFYGALRHIEPIIRRCAPDVVYAQDPLVALTAALVMPVDCRLFMALHWTFGHWDVPRARRMWGGPGDGDALYQFERTFIPNLVRNTNFERLVCVGSYFKQWAESVVGLPSSKLAAVPNAVDTDLFVPQPRGEYVRRQLGVGADDFLILLPGRLIERKGQLDAVRAVGALPANAWAHGKVFLVLSGDTTHSHPADNVYIDRLTGALRSHGLNGRTVVVKTPYTRMPDLYSAADLVVLTSRSEGLSTVLLEAMACEKAVVASDIPGHNDVIKHGETGWLFPLGETTLLTEAIAAAVADRRTAKLFGEAGREYVIDHHSMTGHALTLMSLFNVLH